jgi:hypothetical protein
VTARAAPNLAFYAVVLLLAIVAPQVAAFGFLAIAIAIPVLAARGARPAPSQN